MAHISCIKRRKGLPRRKDWNNIMEDSMEPSSKGRRNLLLQTTGALISGALLLPTGAQAQSNHRNWKGTSGYRYGGPNRGPNLPQHYTQTNLVSDSPNTAIAKTYDPRLRSAWGMAQSSTGHGG